MEDLRLPSWAWWPAVPPETPALGHAVQVLRRGGALEKLVFAGGAPLDRALQEHQRAHRNMGRNDRLLLGTAVYWLARNRNAIRWAMPEQTEGAGDLLVVALLDVVGRSAGSLAMSSAEAARFEAARAKLDDIRASSAAALTAEENRCVKDVSEIARKAFVTLFSIPDWWLDLGPWNTMAAAIRELSRLKAPQSLCLRVQSHRASRLEILDELKGLGIPARPTARSPWGIVVQGRHNVLGTDLYRRGRVEVQDEGSQLAACLCDPRRDERVLDFCAGAGGKSLALGAMLGGRGSIVATDPDPGRLAKARARARRAGLGNIRVVGDPGEVERLGPYDLVLVDAPCSSSGTLRRNPDAAWRWARSDVERLAMVQAGILDRAARLVAAKGHLVYVTCSVLEPENGNQIEAFLVRHPQFELEPPGDRRAHGPLLDVPDAGKGAFRVAANLTEYDGDGFFLARFRRHSQS